MRNWLPCAQNVPLRAVQREQGRACGPGPAPSDVHRSEGAGLTWVRMEGALARVGQGLVVGLFVGESGWFYAVLCVAFRLSAEPVLCACRNLRIRTRVTPDRVGAQASDLRGH